MRSLLELLGLSGSKREGNARASQSEALKTLARHIDTLPAEKAIYVAAIAYLLARVAHADLDVDADEKEKIASTLVASGGLSRHEAELVAKLAEEQTTLLGGTEDYLVGREINRLADRKQKIALLKNLFAVAAASGGISSVESKELRQIASELKLEREDYVQLRVTFKNALAARSDKNNP
jgi:uncharacterized tellurite resistance protein B-like protein